MSYCRFGPDSDLYVVRTGDGYQCICCPSEEGDDYKSWYGDTLEDLLNHLVDHVGEGHKVPHAAMERVAIEMTKAFNAVRVEILTMLLYKMSIPNMIFNHYVQSGRMIYEMQTEFNDAMDALDNLKWPEDD